MFRAEFDGNGSTDLLDFNGETIMSEPDVIQVFNPYTEQEVGKVPRGTRPDVDRAVRTAQEGAAQMGAMPLHRRATILAETARLLMAEVEPLARLITS